MKNLEKDLQELGKSLKELAQKTGRISKRLASLEKAKPSKKPGARAKTAKKAVSKKPAKPSATGTVLEIIKRSRKAVDTAALKKKTGFKDTNIRAIVSRLKKQGKIKSERKGIYQKA
jgi:septal ring factor EnvC (AmiA/AmiB activator)